MIRMVRCCICALMLITAPLGHALTYQPMLDDDLLKQSSVVVRGQILSSDEVTGASANLTYYQLAVEKVYKGVVPANEITIAVPGNPSAGARKIPGAPSFSENSDVVLFLTPNEAGEYRLLHLPLGAFVASRDALGQSVYIRQLSSSKALPSSVPSRAAVSESPRVAKSFLKWLGDPAAEYEASTLDLGGGGKTEKDEFTTLGTPPSRWWQFDNGVTAVFRAHNSGQPGMTNGGFAEFQTGISVWTNDPGSNVRYSYGGTTSATGGLNTADGVNAILFNDPNGEVEGTFTCSEGGVLAIGGFVTTGSTRSFDGRVFGEISEGDIVTNNGAGCFFGMQNNTNGEEIFAHELGHTLGLGHSCEDTGSLPIIGLPLDPDSCDAATTAERDAIMKATPHADGRGADLRSDDLAGISFLYPNQGGSTTPDPDPDPGNGGGEPEPTPTPAGGGGGGGGGGGCALGATSAIDPMLPGLLMMSILVMGYRRKSIRISRSGES